MSTAAEVLRDFVNTYDVESATDQLTTPAALAAWLRERDLPHDDDPTEIDLEIARDLREGLRTALLHNHDPQPYPTPPALDAALARLPLRVTLSDGVPGLAPVAGNGVARIASLIPAAHAAGTWPRLKVCAQSTCREAFIDSSKNRSRAWCSMSVCGNRTKTRTYRARRQAEGPMKAS